VWSQITLTLPDTIIQIGFRLGLLDTEAKARPSNLRC
jgi:hypothetical protein